jgi:hypothetical protein
MKIEYKTRRNPPFSGNLAIVEYWEDPSSCPLTVEGFEQGSTCYDDLGKAKELLLMTHPNAEILSEIPILVGRLGQTMQASR